MRFIIGTRRNDTITGAGRADLIIGQGGRDVIHGGRGNDLLFGGSGDDTMFGDEGNDLLFGGSGRDLLSGGQGRDLLDGGSGDDVLDGGADNDTLLGGSGNDTLYGGTGRDLLDGGSGADILDGGAGADTVDAGSGDDVAIFVAADSAGAGDLYMGGAGRDTLRILLTAAEWARSAVQADMAAYLAFLTARVNPASGLANDALFAFGSLGLRAGGFERLEVYVDGRLVDMVDNPVAANADAVSTGENAAFAIDVLANDSAPDGVASVVLVTPPGRGALALQADNRFLFTPGAAFDYLAAGQTTTETFTYRVTDADGDTATATVTITIVGTNDAAAIGGQASASVVEDSGLTVGGALTATDVDSPATFAPLVNMQATYGRFSLTAAGVWTYVLDNTKTEVNALNVGSAPLTDTVTVQTVDGTQQVLTVTITGANDAAVITGTATASAIEDGGLPVGGALTATDVDSPATFIPLVNVAASYGRFSLTAAGVWSYVLDNANSVVDALNVGSAPLTDTITVQTADGTPQVLTVTIAGANDAAVISGVATAAATEDSAAPVGGALFVGDVDSPATFTPLANVEAAYGRFSLTTAGVWSYVLDNTNTAVNALNGSSPPLTDTITVQTADGTAQVLTVTIAGTNDAPVLAAALADQAATAGSPFAFTVPAGAFTDVDSAITLSARLASGEPLPSWLSFDSATRAFSGTPAAGDVGALSVRVTASDGSLAADDVFVIAVAPGGGGDPPPAPVFGLAESDEAAPGQSNVRIVALTGAAGANDTIELFRVGETTPFATTLSDVNGAFRFTGIVLQPGDNDFYARGTDAATGLSSSSAPVAIDYVAPAPGAGNAALFWNSVALDAIRETAASPAFASRALAIESLAVYNALAAIDGTPGYLFSAAPAPDASAAAAIARAAHDVLSHLFPSRASALDAALASFLAAIPEGASKTAGLALGSDVAQTTIQLRDGDGWKDVVTDPGSQQTGKWQPTGPFYAPGLDAQWADLDTFALTTPDQFDPGPPPGAIPDTVTTDSYANDYERTQALGRADAPESVRSDEQTAIARFWADGAGTVTPAGHWNGIASGAIQAQGLGLAETARLLLQLNLAAADSGIAAWSTKYAYDTWRPETAFQDGGTFGGVTITPDRDWQPLLVTPPFPEYISGHSTYSAAAATILTAYFGEDYAFSTSTTSLPGNPTRDFLSFWDAAREAGESRIYGGIHFEFSNVAGQELGTDIANWVLGLFDGAADTVAPRVAFLSPEGLATRTAPTIAGIVTDNLSGVARISWSLDGGPLNFLTPAPDGRFSIPTALAADGSADGPHRLTLSAVDAAGNASSFAAYDFVLAATGPGLVLTGVADGATVTEASRLAGDFDLDPGVALASLTYRFDGGLETPVSVTADGSFDAALDLRTLPAGPHTLTLTGIDAAGNIVTSSISVTTQAPAFFVTEVSPDPNEMNIGVTFRPQVEFSRAADVSTLNANSIYAVDSTGARIAATVVPYSDGTGAWLLFADALPGSSNITIRVEGDLIRSIDGAVLDAANAGAGASDLAFDFTTVSNTPVPGTTISGIVLDPGADFVPMTPDDARAGPDNQLAGFGDNLWLNPLAGVKVYILGRESEAVFTDENGRFTLTNVPGGHVKVAVDGRTWDDSASDFFFPEMVMDVLVTPGVENTVMGGMGSREARLANADNPAVYLPRIAEDSLVPVSATEPTTVHAANAAGSNITAEQLQLLSLTVQPGSIVDENGVPVDNPTIGISTVPPQIVMDMLPPGVLQHSFDITIQAPRGAVFTEAAVLTMPNVFGLKPGEKQFILSFDHTTGQLVINGTATVSADGLTVVSDPGSGIMAPGWHGLGPPGSRGQGDIDMNCDDPEHTDPNHPTFEDWTRGATNAGDYASVGGQIFETVTGAEVPGPVSKVIGVTGLVSDGLAVGDTMTQMYTAHLTGDTGGYGPPDLGYYSLMTFKLVGDVGKSVVDVFGMWTDRLPANAATAPLKVAGKVLPASITAAQQFGQVTSGTADPFGGMNNVRDKLAGLPPPTENANWTPPPTRELPSAIAGFDTAVSLFESVGAARSAAAFRAADGFSRANTALQQVDLADPVGNRPVTDLLDTLNEMVEGIQAAIDAAIEAEQAGRDFQDMVDAIIDAYNRMLEAYSHDYGEPIDTVEPDGSPTPDTEGDDGPDDIVVETVEFGPTFCAVLKNLYTGDEQRFKFNPEVGIDQFLAPDTAFRITVYDPVSKQVGEATFVSRGTGLATSIPSIMMFRDDGAVGPGGFTPTAAYVLGLNPNVPDNFVPGVNDSEALQTGLAEQPQLANVTGVVGEAALQGDAKAIEIVASGANSAGQTAYLATGSHGLAIVDVTNPRNPVVLSQLDLAGDATDVAVDQSTRFAVVATGNAVVIVDAGDPSRPTVQNTVAAPGATQVETANGLFYFVADGVLTAYDAAAREAVAYLNLPGSGAVSGIATDGQHLYVLRGGSGNWTLVSVDIGGAAPAVEGTLALTSATLGGGFAIDGRIVLSEGILYIPSGTPSGQDGGYATIDVRDPSAPTLLSGVDSESIAGAMIASNGSGRAVTVQQQSLFGLGTFNVLDIVNVGNPANTADFISRINLEGRTAQGAPVQATPFQGFPNDVAIAGGTAFVATQDGLTSVQYLRPDTLGVAPTASIDLAAFDVDPNRAGIQIVEGSRLPIQVRTTDDVQVKSVELLVNGTSVQRDVSPDWVLDPQLPGILANGGPNVTIQARATDTGGNTGLSQAVTVELVADNRLFALTGVTPAFDGTAPSSTRKVTYSFSTALDPTTVAASRFELRDGNGQLLTPVGIELRAGGTRVEVTYDSLPLGDYVATLKATDIRDVLGRTLGATDFVGVNRFEVGPFDHVWAAGPFGLWSNASNWLDGDAPIANGSIIVQLAAGAVSQFDLAPLPDDGRYGALSVTGAGKLQVGTGDTLPFRGLAVSDLSNTATLELAPRGSMSMFDGDIFNAGVIRLTANTIPYGAFGTGAFSSLNLRGEDIQLTGGGVIELQTANPLLGANDFRPAINLYSNGFELRTDIPNTERALPSKLVNVDNTISGGGKLGGNGEIVNGEAGVIQSTLDTRLVLETQLFNLFGQGAFSFSFFEKHFITNQGIIRATASSTLQINGSIVRNDGGELLADGDNSLLYLTGTTVVQGGLTQAIGSNANIWIENASFVDGAVLDTRGSNAAFVTGFLGFIDAELFGGLRFNFQGTPPGGIGYGASLGGVIRNHGEIEVFDAANITSELSVFRDTIFTGGGVLKLFDFENSGRIRLQGGEADYPFREETDPVPDAPPAVRLINHDNLFQLAGTFRPYWEVRDFDVFDPVTSTYDTVERPATAPLRIENLRDGTIESYLLINDPGEERRAVFEDMAIDNSGLIRTNNATGIELVRTNVNNAWFDYDAAMPGAPRAPWEGRVEADFGTLVLKESTVGGGELNVNIFGGLQVARVDLDGDGVSRLAGVQMRTDDGTTSTIAAGAALQLTDRPLAGGGEEQTFIDLRGELRIEANNLFGFGYGLRIGGADAAVVTIAGGGSGKITLATEAGAFEDAGIRSEGEGGELRLNDLTVAGWGDLADNGIDLAIFGPGAVGLEATDNISIGANKTTIEAGATLVDRSNGDITFDGGLVWNQGLITIENGNGGFAFNNTVQNDGAISATPGTLITFRGNAVGAGRYEQIDDGEFVFDGVFQGRVVFDAVDEGGPEAGRVVFNSLVDFQAVVETFNVGDSLEFEDIAFADAFLSYTDDENGLVFTLQDNEDTIQFRMDAAAFGSYAPDDFGIMDRGDGGTRFYFQL